MAGKEKLIRGALGALTDIFKSKDAPVDESRRSFIKGAVAAPVAGAGALVGLKVAPKVIEKYAGSNILEAASEMERSNVAHPSGILRLEDLFQFPKVQKQLIDDYLKEDGYELIDALRRRRNQPPLDPDHDLSEPSSILEAYRDLFDTPGSLSVADTMRGEPEIIEQVSNFISGGLKRVDLKDPVLKTMHDELIAVGETPETIKYIMEDFLL